MARYIFITGGVVSSLGKGLASAALGALGKNGGGGARASSSIEEFHDVRLLSAFKPLGRLRPSHTL